MLPQIDALLTSYGGASTRARLLTAVTRGQLDHEIRSGQLVSPFARVYCRPWDVDLAAVQHRGALMSVGPPAALSHLSVLAARGIPAATRDSRSHVTVPPRRYPRPQERLVAHRMTPFPALTRLDGLIVTTVAEAVVASWPLLDPPDRRGPAITAVRQWLTTPGELVGALQRRTRLAGRAELAELIALLADGCESELEIWGHRQVFDVPGLRHGVRQRRIAAGGARYRLDLAFEDERVAVELDGRWHAGVEQRNRDVRRDAALAAIGWLTVRFTHARLTDEIDEVRRELLAILAHRRP